MFSAELVFEQVALTVATFLHREIANQDFYVTEAASPSEIYFETSLAWLHSNKCP